ncbi:MAG: pyridoxamine 5'-phosphate oxidase family protein [Candidatus Dormibacteraceae bacterium]
MASWRTVEAEAPEFAERVRARFEAGTNKTLATLRRDGAPRISATEAEFRDGEVTFGSMPGAVKLADLRRDPRMALHSPTLEPPPGDPSAQPGDAKLSGRAIETPRPGDAAVAGAGYFRVEIEEVVLTYVGTPADHLVIESWHPGRGWGRRTRT